MVVDASTAESYTFRSIKSFLDVDFSLLVTHCKTQKDKRDAREKI